MKHKQAYSSSSQEFIPLIWSFNFDFVDIFPRILGKRVLGKERMPFHEHEIRVIKNLHFVRIRFLATCWN